MVKNQNNDVNYKLRQMILNSQGEGSMADLSEIFQRIEALEENKQDKITAGQGILISGNNIAAQNIIDDTRNSSTTVWSSNKVKSLVESFEGGVNVVLTSSRPSESEGIEKTMYYVGDSAPYHIWFFLENNYIDFGTTEISLENYYTKLEVDNLLEFKVDKEEGKVLISLEDLAQITTNKNDIIALDDSKVDKEENKTLISSEDLSQISLNKLNILNLDSQKVDKVSGKSLISDVNINQITTNRNDITDLKSDVNSLTSTKQDKITDSTLSSISDSTTVSSVNASSKTNKTFSLSALWGWIVSKLTSNTEKGIRVSGGKIGHSNSITAPTSKRILQATYDTQGHVTAIENEFNWSNTYNTSAENQLFTRKGANAMYTELGVAVEETISFNSSYIAANYSKVYKVGKVYMCNLAFQIKSADVPANTWLIKLSGNVVKSGTEVYCVLHCTDLANVPATRLLQLGGSSSLNQFYVKTNPLPGGKYYFGNCVIVKNI